MESHIRIGKDEKPFVVINEKGGIKVSFGKTLRFRDARNTALSFRSISFDNADQLKELLKIIEFTRGILKDGDHIEYHAKHGKDIELYIDADGKIRLGK